MNIVVFNVKFSNNVGDGVVAETTEYVLGSLPGNNCISTIDLGGRVSYGDSGIKAPSVFKIIINTALKALPEWLGNPLRQHLTYALLKRDAIPRWKVAIEKSDRVIIGGGHLISDVELYFPLRLHAIVSLAKELKKPVYLHAVGVSDPKYFSAQGRKLFKEIFKNNPYLHYVSVRDELSRQHWCSIFEGEVLVVPDTGNFTCGTYSDYADGIESKGVIGIGVMASDLVIKDAPGKHTKVMLRVDDYIELGKKLLAMGYSPLYFTNGAPEDEVRLARIQHNMSMLDKVMFAERPMEPKDLVKTILRCEKIIAYRLHACIVATSLGVPAIGLAWDKKLSSYFDSIGAAERVCSQFDAEAVVRQLVELAPLELVFTKEPYLKLVR